MFQPTKEWVNKVNLSSFELENFFKFVLVWLAREKINNLTPQPCLQTLMQTLLSANQSARTILVIYKSRSQTSVKSQKIKAMVFNKQNSTLHGLHVHDGARF